MKRVHDAKKKGVRLGFDKKNFHGAHTGHLGADEARVQRHGARGQKAGGARRRRAKGASARKAKGAHNGRGASGATHLL